MGIRNCYTLLQQVSAYWKNCGQQIPCAYRQIPRQKHRCKAISRMTTAVICVFPSSRTYKKLFSWKSSCYFLSTTLQRNSLGGILFVQISFFSSYFFRSIVLKIKKNKNYKQNLFQKSLENVWWVQKTAVLLHSLNGTRHMPSNVKAKVLWKDYIRHTQRSTKGHELCFAMQFG